MPKIHELHIHKLHPTQMTVGMIEVHDKKKHLAALSKQEQRDFMQAHPIPVVFGPEQKLYLTDHHHLGRAAFEAEVETGWFVVEADLSGCDHEEFWREMDRNKWVHPVDQNGVRHDYSLIPHHLEKLIDDPYRSLAGYVRNAGGYQKTPTAFAEFVWADFFRAKIPEKNVVTDFHAAVRMAIALAATDEAERLPGYKG